ncbi:MAG: ferrous iron transport protein A [Planctomycetes bacterium]|nr:ferrous iron transport protein A [Planctomycetota bacterium]
MKRTLADVPVGSRVVVESVNGPMGARLGEMGLIAGAEVEIVQAIPLGGPLVLDRQGFVFALRRRDACEVRVRGGTP